MKVYLSYLLQWRLLCIFSFQLLHHRLFYWIELEKFFKMYFSVWCPLLGVDWSGAMWVSIYLNYFNQFYTNTTGTHLQPTVSRHATWDSCLFYVPHESVRIRRLCYSSGAQSDLSKWRCDPPIKIVYPAMYSKIK